MYNSFFLFFSSFFLPNVLFFPNWFFTIAKTTGELPDNLPKFELYVNCGSVLSFWLRTDRSGLHRWTRIDCMWPWKSD